MWNGFIHAMSWITRCIEWKIGNGKNIKVGLDPIASVSSDYTLPEGLRLYLKDYGAAHSLMFSIEEKPLHLQITGSLQMIWSWVDYGRKPGPIILKVYIMEKFV